MRLILPLMAALLTCAPVAAATAGTGTGVPPGYTIVYVPQYTQTANGTFFAGYVPELVRAGSTTASARRPARHVAKHRVAG